STPKPRKRSCLISKQMMTTTLKNAGKSALQKEKPDPDDRVVDTSDVDEETYRDISAFPDNIATQITFRLSILRYLARAC
ncbi:hypothetical protein, partial [uncultured Vibrio sp.]|uniref:hypothetical protein n=1 Tax=uncultured Vibrio sp. TaxID=114054 RepID=UPI00262482D4